MRSSRNLNWLVLAAALTVPFLGSLIYFVWVPEGPIGQAAYFLTKIFTLVFPLLFLKWMGVGGLLGRRESGRRRWPGWRSVIVTGLLSGIVISSAGVLLMLTPLGDLVRTGAGEVVNKAEGLGFREHFLLYALFVSFFHSALEEYYWRWFAYGHLRAKLGPWPAHGLAALAFGGHHFVITMQFFPAPLALFLTTCVMVGGIIWTLMYERQGTVVGCWVSHACVDVFIMVIGFQLISSAAP